MKKFLFVIALTPDALQSAFRKDLAEISMQSLHNQESRDWEAILLGEKNRDEGNLHFMNLGGGRKQEKLHYAANWLMKQQSLPEYIIRFDDDDLISPAALASLPGNAFDCYADRVHWFHDLSSGMTSAQERPWLANTIIHKTEHALSEYGEYEPGLSFTDSLPVLLENDHSQTWHKYYRDKNIIYAPEQHPLYLRLLSPESITSVRDGDYKSYLEKFGFWNKRLPSGFEAYKSALSGLWLKHYGAQKKYRFSAAKYFRYKLSSFIRSLNN